MVPPTMGEVAKRSYDLVTDQWLAHRSRAHRTAHRLVFGVFAGGFLVAAALFLARDRPPGATLALAAARRC